MSTEKPKQASRKSVTKAQRAQAKNSPPSTVGMSTATRDRLSDTKFAFPDDRKEPLTDASHVRNAIARFDQVGDVTDAERDRAWKRIKAAAKRFDVEVEASDWRELARGGKGRGR